MTIKHILVHLDATRHTDKRVDIALGLAKRFSAHLTAVFAQAEPDAPTDMMPNAAVTSSSKVGQEALAAFEGKAKAESIPCSTRIIPAVSYSQLTKHLTYAARDSDLVVMGQHDSEAAKGECPEDLPEQVILRCGRPVLVIPYAGHFEHIGERVLVGWNGTRESARALNDALPFMTDAKSVRMLSINPPKEILEHHDQYNQSALDHLKIHGIEAEVVQEPNPDVPVASLLISRTADHGTDLLVMGAHSHTGFPKNLRGSVTRDLLRQLTVPALLSH